MLVQTELAHTHIEDECNYFSWLATTIAFLFRCVNLFKREKKKNSFFVTTISVKKKKQ